MRTIISPQGVRVVVIDDLPLRTARALIASAIADARHNGTSRIAIDYSAWTGNDLPSFAFRIDTVHEWSIKGAPHVAVAVVLPRRLIHGEKIGVVVARRLRFIADVFDDLHHAVDWLVNCVDLHPATRLPRLTLGLVRPAVGGRD